jgi:hypothetical protein
VGWEIIEPRQLVWKVHSGQFILGAWNQLQVMTCRIGDSLQNSSPGLSAGSSILKRNSDCGSTIEWSREEGSTLDNLLSGRKVKFWLSLLQAFGRLHSQLLLQCHACLSVAMLPTTKAMDSSFKTVSPNKLFYKLLGSWHFVTAIENQDN